MQSHWSRIYDSISTTLSNTGPVILGFNTNIDALVHIEQKHLNKYVKSDQQVLDILEKVKNLPGTIHTLDDLFAGILWCFSRGKAAEWLVFDHSVYKWISKHLGFEEQRMGGQAGIMANLLSLFTEVIVHVCNLSKTQADLFHHKNVFVPHFENKKPLLIHPQQAWQKNVPDLVHWIIEFKKGDILQLGDQLFVCPRDNRFIASFDTPNSSLEINPDFLEGIKPILSKTQACILAGFHLLQPEIQKTTYQTRIDFIEDIVRSWLTKNKELKIHFEFAYMSNPIIREAVLNRIVRLGHSLGVNEVELATIWEVVTRRESKKGLWHDLFELYQAALEVFHYLEIYRLHVRTLENNLMIITKDYPLNAQSVRDAMLFGAILGAAKAKLGKIDSQKDFKEGRTIPVSTTGIESFKRLAYALEERSFIANPEPFLRTGICEQEDNILIVIPTKVVEKPALTVGLGDTISSSAFLKEISFIN
ncbi:MAG: ADP-dependent glucokinase/phosphofructokinase [Promethearchaeota archaeon]